MAIIAYELQQLYRLTFGGVPPRVDESAFTLPKGQVVTNTGSVLKEDFKGKEIWLPCEFSELWRIKDKSGNNVFAFNSMKVPYATVSITGANTWIETPLNGRAGTVKELYNTGDYNITVKGFLIDEDRRLWPEEQVNYFRHIKESGEPIAFNNALTDIFLIELGNMVVIKNLTFLEVTGGRRHVRPFTMELVSDSIFNLIVED